MWDLFRGSGKRRVTIVIKLEQRQSIAAGARLFEEKLALI
ncbi:MAG: hypothetical protein OFPII_10620 [Osedax symbiont Rs1]|nr:MAG: hypothetical protein OFPII_10620 [Osedax symbiont Rs1]